ncbi:TonB-dependent siderophore receptor [Loktanella agnita]|uniref:TonB-dependent siderophore receptor n=1 Tax=Loktanella agnita TaxID=287097 RepID=UPI0039860B00
MLYRTYVLSIGPVALTFALSASAVSAQTAEAETVLDPIVVASADDDSLDNFDGYTAEAATSATRTPGDLRTTPRSVSVIGEDQVRDQGARSIEQAIGYVPGVMPQTFGSDGRYDQYAIRGFDAQNAGYYRDGLPLRTFGYAAWRTEPFLLDRIEVLRGPTADLYGANEPGGLVNAITKRPEFEQSGTARGSLFGEGGGELALDVTGPVSDDFAYRLTGVFNESGTAFEEVDQGRIFFAPSVTWQPSDATKLTIYGQYQKDDIGDTYVLLPEYGTQHTNPLGQYGNDFYTGNPDRNTIESEQSYLGYEFEQDIGGGRTLLSRARIATNDWYNETSYVGAFYASSAQPGEVDTAIMIDFDVDQELEQISFDNGVQQELSFGNVAATLIAGVDYYKVTSDYDRSSAIAGHKDLESGTLDTSEASPASASSIAQDVAQTGVYLVGQAEIGTDWVLNGGLRYDDVRTDIASNSAFGSQEQSNEVDFTSASLGLSYNFVNGMTFYGNAARSFNLPPSGVDSEGNTLDVQESDGFELGARFQPVGTGSLFTLAVFNITKKNTLQPSPSVAGTYEQIGEVKSRGLELGATRRFDNGISVLGSYTFLNAEITEDATNEGNKLARVPSETAALWLGYAFQTAQLEGLRLGVGARYVGDRYSDSANTESRKAPASTLLDASVSYDWGDWNATLAARNLADESKVTFCTAGNVALVPAGNNTEEAGGCALGEGRTVTLSLTRTF